MENGGPSIRALFQKPFAGDDTLLALAGRRFGAVGLGPEFNPSGVSELAHLLRFLPSPGTPFSVHLPREIEILEPGGAPEVERFLEFAEKGATGFILHDTLRAAGRLDEYRRTLSGIDASLRAGPAGAMLFIEYAAGLPIDVFCEIVESLEDLSRVSACIDIGHVGVRRTRDVYGARYKGEDVCDLTPSSAGLSRRIDAIEEAMAAGLDAVLRVIARVGASGKPLHFHLHDAHPLWTRSLVGVSDHISFFERIPVSFVHRGRSELDLMFGPAGLAAIVAAACRAVPPERLSLSLEIHPVDARSPLDEEAADLFSHWTDRTNAERMYRWTIELLRNHELLRRLLATGAC